MFTEMIDVVMEKHFPTVKSAGCIVRQDGHILVIRTNKGWEFPKGAIDVDEDPQSAAIRETYEETGIQCDIVDDIPKQSGSTLFYFARPRSNNDPSPTKHAEKSIKKAKWKKPDDIRNKFISKQSHLLDLL
jgi:8-oxo-dGTP pyrophosphatase MutT (NUDIX family)